MTDLGTAFATALTWAAAGPALPPAPVLRASPLATAGSLFPLADAAARAGG